MRAKDGGNSGAGDKSDGGKGFALDSALALALFTALVYLVVVLFEEGYNAYFGIPGTFVQADLPTAYQVFGFIPIAWEIVLTRMDATPHWIWIPTFFAYLGGVGFLCYLARGVYLAYPSAWIAFAFLAFGLSFTFTPLITALVAFASVFVLLVIFTVLPKRRESWYEPLETFLGRPPWLFRMLVIVVYLMMPSYFLGYTHAGYGTTYQVVDMPSTPTSSSRHYVAVRFGTDFVLLKPYCMLDDSDSFCASFMRRPSVAAMNVKEGAPVIIDSLLVIKTGDTANLIFRGVRWLSKPLLFNSTGKNLNRFSTWLCIRGSEKPC